MSLIIDVISRKTSVKQTLINPGDVTVVIYEPSVVQVHAQASAVARYVRDGNDLLIYMQDGTVIRCNGYFLQAANTSEQSELVFVDGQQLTHVTFADTAAGGLAPVELTAQTTAIESIAPYLDIVGQTTAFPWGWLAGAAVGGGALGALLASGGDDDSKTEVVNNPPPAEPGNATPSFLVTDNQGDQRGILSANDTTDDTTPTFSGSGQAGATIQIKDSNGDTIASTQVGSDGRWSVDLPTQSAGEHTWSVVQIVGSTITDAGSITLTIDNSQASVQVATTAGDNIINASEQAAGFTLSGTSSHLAQGTELTVTLNGKTYTTSVGANGAWSVQVPTADAQALGEGNQAVLVSGKDATGNTVTGAQLLTVDTQPPTLAINTIAQDNIISAAEHNVALVLSGTSNAEAGQTVTLTVNGKSHTATVGSDGTWQVTLPATEVQALAEGNYAVNASVSDRAGNSTSHSANFTVDTSAPVVSVNTVAGDDILNNAEQAVAQIISGQVSGASPGDTVTVKLGTHVLTGIVLADGSWNVALDPAVTRTLDRGANTIFVTVTDAAGNTGAASRAITLVGVSPLITINTVSGDDIISGAEKGAPLTLTGSTQQAETGQTVTVTLAGQSFTTTVQADGSWSLTVPAAAMGNLPDGAVAITASVTDLSGNTGNTSRTITVDSQAPALSIDPLTADNIINAAESGQDLPITGTTDAQPGQTVTVTLNGQTYQGIVQSDGTWSVTVPAANVDALADGNATVTASVNDVAGNPTSVSRVALVDATPPVVTINPVATDNVINTPEHTQAQIISGTVTGAQAGDIVTVTLNNSDYTTVVDGSGNWSLGVPASVVSGLVDGSYPVSVSVTDRAGNSGSQSLTVTVNTAAPLIGINSIAGDDVINASEKGTDVQITGTSDQPVNTAITVTLNGQNYTTTTDASGNWSVTVPASAVIALGQANYTVTAAVTNSIGNSNTASHNVLVDSALPGVTINPVATDDIINAAEAGVAQSISGQVTGAAVGNTVTVTLGGNTYTTTVQAGLSWSVSVPAADLQALGNGDLTVSASVTNQNGNTGSGTRDITIDANLPGLRVDTVAGDDVVNIIEHGQALVVSGSSSGLAEGTPLTVTINNVEYTTAVQADGSWSVGVTAAQVSAWPAGTVSIAVSGESSAGNPISITHPVTVDLTPAAITINTIATDDVINAAEKGADLTLSGTTTNVEPGQTVTVTFGGKNYTATVASDGSWTATVPAADLASLPEGSASAQASVSNINGNSASAVHNYSVDSSAPTIIINTVASDNIVNASEADAGVTVSGSTTATPTIVSYTDDVGQRQGTLSSSQATDDTTPLLNGVLSGPLASGEVVYLYRNGLLLGAVTMVGALNWTYSDSGLVSGAYTYSARVVDLAGNITASSDFVLTVDTSIPTTLAQITSQTTRDTTPIISGVITAALASGQYVEVVINGKTYTSEPGGAVVVDPAHNTWYVQLPDTDALTVSATAYTVTAQVKSSAGNGNNANISNGTVTVNAAIDYTPTWTTVSKTTAWGLTYGLDSHGMWTVLANQQVMQSTDPLTWSKTALTLYQSGNNYATSSIADYDRNGTGDLFITRDDYGTGYINGFTNNGDGTFSSAIQVTVGTLTWYGSIVAFDKEGDGYLDFWIGDAGGPDSNTFLWNNAGTLVGTSTTSNSGGSATVGGAVTGYLSLNEGSGVDLNNDGRIDLVQHTYNLNNYYTLSSLINQGNGTFVWGQNTTNTFLSGAGSGAMSSSVSMTWADFDGDGDMDLFLPASQGRANYGSLLFNTNGVLGSPVAVGATATTYASQFSLAVDWNHDGLMDIARIAQTGQSYLYTNVSNASNWTQSALGGSQSGTTSGVAAMDYDWDGAVDVLVTKQSGSVYLIRNTNTVSYGTSLHLRITDPNGINVYYGNTVKLYNSAGVLVATQIINPQSGMGVNDTSALVNFYGLNAGETYNAVLIKSTGTTASNIDQTVNTSWGGLQATDATHAYDLSAEAGTASNNGKFVGTGYNDTFFATAGTDTYDGSGGWVYSSGTGTWLANGGMDVVDFRLSTVGVTANLSSTAAQATGFNTSTFTNIEGISGSNFNDTLTGSSGDNQLEGRGGNDTLNIGNGGHDTLLYKLLNASDATGGNGSDVVNGFTVGTWEGTADTDRIDIRELLQGSGYTGNGKASYVNGVATLDAQAGNIGDFVKVTQSGSDTIVQIDRDGTGGTFATTNVVTLTGVHTDLATLLANHQLMVV
ncbi:Ig-like domain-containing protein [Escherichia coli]|uniref:BapA-related adhesin SiiEA n=1 Tax=Escherichia coli TaxID=562 RepID=UPI0010813765|nr:Ig-like domain-containing protein [Escherichia coli]TGI06528.1 Ig-like domain-containing protein [Escherichia coli]